MAEGAGEELRFRVGPIELEFLVEVGRELSTEAGIKFWVVSIGAKGGATSATTHRIRLTLEPKTTRGEDVEVSDTGERPR
jgi:hypothetical protein